MRRVFWIDKKSKKKGGGLFHVPFGRGPPQRQTPWTRLMFDGETNRCWGLCPRGAGQGTQGDVGGGLLQAAIETVGLVQETENLLTSTLRKTKKGGIAFHLTRQDGSLL